ncbi:hypothetical protein LCGC14_1543940 [marine sediment metagenome]|uniref:Uncharacterized protein n=1 Tax=marine sediment metagenome TaxID=412755 RepID=A0A0F9LSZ8_9ZZZZ
MNRRGFVSRAVDYVAGLFGGIAALGTRRAAVADESGLRRMPFVLLSDRRYCPADYLDIQIGRDGVLYPEERLRESGSATIGVGNKSFSLSLTECTNGYYMLVARREYGDGGDNMKIIASFGIRDNGEFVEY